MAFEENCGKILQNIEGEVHIYVSFSNKGDSCSQKLGQEQPWKGIQSAWTDKCAVKVSWGATRYLVVPQWVTCTWEKQCKCTDKSMTTSVQFILVMIYSKTPNRQYVIIWPNDGLFYWCIMCVTWHRWVNSSPPGQNGCHFSDDNFKCIIMNEKFCILIQISLNFVPKGPIDNIIQHCFR